MHNSLQLHLNVENLPEDTHRHFLKFENSSIQFLTTILWPHQRKQDPFGSGSSLGFGFGENEADGEEAPKPPPKPRGWVAFIDSLEQGRAALKAIQALHQLPDSHAIDGTLMYGLGPFMPENPNQTSGWFNYFPTLQERVTREISAEGVSTIRFSARPFPLPLVAARLRVDSERNDRWWLEFDIECGSGALEFMGHFQDYFFLAIDGVAHRGFSIQGMGYTASDKSHDSATIVMSIANLAAGREILEGLRKVHDNLPRDALIDVTQGEVHGEIHRFRRSHLKETMSAWNQLSESIYCLASPFNRTEGKADEKIRHLQLLSEINDPSGMGIRFYVPTQFADEFEDRSPSILKLEVEPSMTINEVVQQALPDGWVVFPMAPRWVALIPKTSLLED
ncbi:MAG: hypothetical protein AAGH89_00025 [Verrucomicrobiota bacterium]